MYRDTWAEVSLGRILDNMRKIRAFIPESAKLMAVIKANGYGHGDIQSAQLAEQAEADYLGVAFLDEAIRLREMGVRLPILILTPIHPEDTALALSHNLMLTVTGASWFKQLPRERPYSPDKPLQVHIKADTGLGRIGIRTRQEWEELLPYLLEPGVVVDGFYTHFATAGHADTSFLELQANRFLGMKEWSLHSGVSIGHYHCAGSSAALRFPHLAMDMVRIGAALYGFYPEKLVPALKLEPALALYSRLMQVKKVNKGDYLGYDNSYLADDEQWIGTVPLGYADGWSQSMRDTEVLVDGQRAKVVGKIAMDQLIVRLPGPCEEGALVTLIGRQGDDQITFAELAAHIGSVAQEISTSLTSRVVRSFIPTEEDYSLWGKETIPMEPIRTALS